MINFDTLFQFLSLCHEFNLTAQALEVIHGNISAQYQLIEACQAYLALLDQFATLPSSPLEAVLPADAIQVVQGHLTDNREILRGMEESRRALLDNQQRIVVLIVTIIPR